jgi:hypothetical protein
VAYACTSAGKELAGSSIGDSQLFKEGESKAFLPESARNWIRARPTPLTRSTIDVKVYPTKQAADGDQGIEQGVGGGALTNLETSTDNADEVPRIEEDADGRREPAARQGEGAASRDHLTVLLNTFQRLDLATAAVERVAKCEVVRRVHVNWAESATPPDLSAHVCCDTTLTFALPLVTHGDQSLNTRFLPVDGTKRPFSARPCD